MPTQWWLHSRDGCDRLGGRRRRRRPIEHNMLNGLFWRWTFNHWFGLLRYLMANRRQRLWSVMLNRLFRHRSVNRSFGLFR